MSTITWLHLSDWHQKGEEFNRDVVREALIKDIEQRITIDTALEKVDFIVFSGDVAQRGKKEEYKAAITKFFDPILKVTNLTPEKLFIVPGNHDLDRETFEILPSALQKTFQNNDEVIKWMNKNNRSKIEEPFLAFSTSIFEYTGQMHPAYTNSKIITTENGTRIALTGLNSALMCSRNKDLNGNVVDQGYLVIGEPQTQAALKAMETSDIKIAILHHPFDWLTEFDRNLVELDIRKHWDFILHGHTHRPEVETSRNLAGNCVIIGAGTCFQKRNADDQRYVNAYNFTNIDLDECKGRVFLRSWHETDKEWLPQSGKRYTNGVYPFNLSDEFSKKKPPVDSGGKPTKLDGRDDGKTFYKPMVDFCNWKLLMGIIIVVTCLVFVSKWSFDLVNYIHTSDYYLQKGQEERDAGNQLLGLHYMALALLKDTLKHSCDEINKEIAKLLPDCSKLAMIVEHERPINGAVFFDNEKQVLTWSDDGTVRLWDATGNTYKQTSLILTHNSSYVNKAVFSKNEDRILTCSMDNTARLWDANSHNQIGPSLTHNNSVKGALFFDNECKILTWSDDKSARLWDAKSGKQIDSLIHKGSVNGAVFFDNESKILTWSDDKTARLWNVKTGKQIDSLIHKGSVNGAVFFDNETQILTWSDDKMARLWDVKSGEQIDSLIHKGSVNGAVFSKNEDRILTWSMDNTARLWDANTHKQIGPSLTHNNSVNGAVFSDNENRILTWSRDNTARLWDVKSGEQIDSLMHKGSVNGAVFSKNENRILTWSMDNTARLWDANTHKQIGPSLTHNNSVNGAVFSDNENRILTWSRDNTARLWDILTEKQSINADHSQSVSGDLDYDPSKFVLQVEALTGTRCHYSGRITCLSPDISDTSSFSFKKVQEEYISFAREHAKTCQYRDQNVFLWFFPEEMPKK